MKFTCRPISVFFVLATLTTTCFAGELSTKSLEGTWMFTHIIMDGEREMKVNRKTQFFADGSLVNYDAAGNEKTRGTYEITADTIIYTDGNGEQTWKVISFEQNSLHVDHRGAEMFFEKH